MANSGYSGTPLWKKLGFRKDLSLRVINAPEGYFVWIGAEMMPKVVKSGGDIVHLFVVSVKDLEKQFHSLVKTLPPDAVIWISWYKKAAKIPTDITEDKIREVVLPTGWVDVKVCAVSEQWSGLKIVLRKAHR